MSTAIEKPQQVLTVERVAKTVEGIPVIGYACAALRELGCQVNLVANSITVDTEIVAQWIPAKTTAYGEVEPSWVVYHTSGQQPMWIVGGAA